MANITFEDIAQEMCPHHKPMNLPYNEWHKESHIRINKGMKQTKCIKCGYWFWEDELNEKKTSANDR
jgi:hypothetical protein